MNDAYKRVSLEFGCGAPWLLLKHTNIFPSARPNTPPVHDSIYRRRHVYVILFQPKGEFVDGGELCVESKPDEVTVVDTKGKLVRVDGRFVLSGPI